MAESVVYLVYNGAGEDESEFWFALATDGEQYEAVIADELPVRRRDSLRENIDIKLEWALKDIEQGAPKPDRVGHVLFYNWTFVRNFVERFDDYGDAVERARTFASDPPDLKTLAAQEES
jgi:hypothetical protein